MSAYRRASADQWSDRPWNSEAGRIAWWADRYRKTRSHVARQSARLFWLQLVAQVGETEAGRMVSAAGMSVPDWLKDGSNGD